MDVRQFLLDRCIPEPNSGCWLWFGNQTRYFYGRIMINNKEVGAHRASYESFVGPIPVGIHVLHRCDNPPCVNPDHLFLGTAGDNVRDCVKKGRFVSWQAAKTSCKHGHPFVGKNLGIRKSGHRKCNECIRARRPVKGARQPAAQGDGSA